MKSKRANFAHIVMDNLVYVFGGISGTGEGVNSHRPLMCSNPAERYDPKADKWEVLEIPNAPQLAAFSWTRLGDNSSKIIILGGTDGDLCQETQWTIDFKAKTAEMNSSTIG